eukprot:940309-Rhodomonas_salina.1
MYEVVSVQQSTVSVPWGIYVVVLAEHSMVSAPQTMVPVQHSTVRQYHRGYGATSTWRLMRSSRILAW